MRPTHKVLVSREDETTVKGTGPGRWERSVGMAVVTVAVVVIIIVAIANHKQPTCC